MGFRSRVLALFLRFMVSIFAGVLRVFFGLEFLSLRAGAIADSCDFGRVEP